MSDSKNQKTLEQLRQLTPDQFEKYIVELFNNLGYRAHHVGGSYDGGIDVIAISNGEEHYIQCKKFISRQVSVHDVRDFYGAIIDKHSDAKAFFITTNIFTLEAERFCSDKPIELIDGKKLMDMVREAGIETPAATHSMICPKCGGKLEQRNGKFGPFFGCSNYPKCHYTRAITE